MSSWLSTTGKVYLPPAQPVARVLETDEYITGTSLYFHAGTERLLTVGHPYFPVKDVQEPHKVLVPKVSGSQFRVFRFNLPDPNRFALIDNGFYDSDHERLVWKLRGIEIGRGGPLGIGTTGHPLYNKFGDTENPNGYKKQSDDNRQDVSLDPKQTQMFIIGCTPAIGEHWDKAEPCPSPAPQQGDCPPIELVNSYIQDGDMCDIGFGAFNFKALQADKSSAPLDVIATVCKWPDFLKMGKDIYGDSLFFFGRREQLYARHFFVRAGTMGDALPEPFEATSDYFIGAQNQQDQYTLGPHIYVGTPSGSLVSSESQLFNRPYWLNRAQGTNNGICWDNQLFVTLVDNTHNTNFTISVKSDGANDNYQYKASDFKQYLRHIEEFEMEFIFQLCKVPLTADVMAHLNVMNPNILDNWQLNFVPPPPSGIEDQYRFLQSRATRCPTQTPATEKEDPYKDLSFWVVDLSERFSSELSQFSLGRRFLYQSGLINGSLKRKRIISSSHVQTNTKRSAKRKRSLK